MYGRELRCERQHIEIMRFFTFYITCPEVLGGPRDLWVWVSDFQSEVERPQMQTNLLKCQDPIVLDAIDDL